MSEASVFVAVPARGARDWQGRVAWGRDAHLTQALIHLLGDDARLVVIPRTRRRSRSGPAHTMLGDVPALTLPHPVEMPRWTRWPLPAALARRAARRLPRGVPAAPSGVVACFDLMRHEAASALARERGWRLITDLMDDWRRHDSMPAWHGHLEERIFPRLVGGDDLLTAVTARAAAPHQALIVPNAGHHAGEAAIPPPDGPRRPVAAFLGTIHARIDAGLLVGLQDRLPGWDVVAAGPVMDATLARKLQAGGVRLEGWWEMADLAERATVAVAPYVRSDFALSGDPLKVYESTARGVPCVTTIPVAVPPAAGVWVAEPEDFADAVHAASGADRREVQAAAWATGSWEDRAATIIDALHRDRAAPDPLLA